MTMAIEMNGQRTAKIIQIKSLFVPLTIQYDCGNL